MITTTIKNTNVNLVHPHLTTNGAAFISNHVTNGLHFISQHKKTKSSTSDSNTVLSPRSKRQNDNSTTIFPKECSICHKYRIQRNKKVMFPPTITTTCAANTISDAAEANENQTLYFQIQVMDLIASEFNYRTSCYREFTRKSSLHKPQQKGNLEDVRKCVEERVLKTFSSYINVVFA